MGYILVLITNPSKKVASKIAMHLLKKKLIACANVFPVDSTYLWRGKIEGAKEWLLTIKSLEKHFKAIKREVKKLHPYDAPAIEKIKTTANIECEQWIKDTLK